MTEENDDSPAISDFEADTENIVPKEVQFAQAYPDSWRDHVDDPEAVAADLEAFAESLVDSWREGHSEDDVYYTGEGIARIERFREHSADELAHNYAPVEVAFLTRDDRNELDFNDCTRVAPEVDGETLAKAMGEFYEVQALVDTDLSIEPFKRNPRWFRVETADENPLGVGDVLHFAQGASDLRTFLRGMLAALEFGRAEGSGTSGDE